MPEPIRVHEKALAHLSRGLYRSPASALRELVSNAWDANATEVRLATSAPYFNQLSVRDNGDGFGEEEFRKLMDGGIGNSDKRSTNEPLRYGRPTIGRLGIGMLGIAQICGRFTLVSKTADGGAFAARIVLYDLIRQKLDVEDPNVISAVTVTSGPGDTDERPVVEVDVGEYTILDGFDLDEYPLGTSIISDDVHPSFVQSFRESYRKTPKTWARFVKDASREETLRTRGDYWRLLWELAALCPIPYIDDSALPNGLVEPEQERLTSYQFSVFVDTYELRKPVMLKDHPAGYTTERIPQFTERVFNRPVTFHGYIVVQEGMQIKPAELRGILIRIKDIGVGVYDQSFLDFGSNEGPRSRWITGEIFVEEGLEDALNVDRDSFNRFHPEFRVIQRSVHTALREVVLPQVYDEIEVRSKRRQKGRDRDRLRHLVEVLGKTSERKVRISGGSATTLADREPWPRITATVNVLKVDLPPAEAMETKPSQQHLARAVMALYELAAQERNSVRRRQVFADALLDLLHGW